MPRMNPTPSFSAISADFFLGPLSTKTGYQHGVLVFNRLLVAYSSLTTLELQLAAEPLIRIPSHQRLRIPAARNRPNIRNNAINSIDATDAIDETDQMRMAIITPDPTHRCPEDQVASSSKGENLYGSPILRLLWPSKSEVGLQPPRQPKVIWGITNRRDWVIE